MGQEGLCPAEPIVAREYGIPAVVNIPGVLKIIKDGLMCLTYLSMLFYLWKG
ncbi:MAG: hypothetical protein K6U04_15155 [Armatimonadetes bacterium]|nr:hypothetical protein [Armatimonadota bacterium]